MWSAVLLGQVLCLHTLTLTAMFRVRVDSSAKAKASRDLAGDRLMAATSSSRYWRDRTRGQWIRVGAAPRRRLPFVERGGGGCWSWTHRRRTRENLAAASATLDGVRSAGRRSRTRQFAAVASKMYLGLLSWHRDTRSLLDGRRGGVRCHRCRARDGGSNRGGVHRLTGHRSYYCAVDTFGLPPEGLHSHETAEFPVIT